MKGFVVEDGDGQPEVCPEGHRGEPELTAARPAEEASE